MGNGKKIKPRDIKLRIIGSSDVGVCSKCHKSFNINELTVHHIIPTRYAKIIRQDCNNEHILTGIQEYGILCRACHNEVEEVYTQYEDCILKLNSTSYKGYSKLVNYQTLNDIFNNKYSNAWVVTAKHGINKKIKKYLLSPFMEAVLQYKSIYADFIQTSNNLSRRIM